MGDELGGDLALRRRSIPRAPPPRRARRPGSRSATETSRPAPGNRRATRSRCRSRSGPPPITTTGSRTVRLAMLSVLAAPVSCNAIRKSEACRTPGARPFFIGITVGRPAPAHSAIWSKPSSKALSIVIVPPKRTPPYIAKLARRSSKQPDDLQEILVPAHGDAVLGDPAEPRHDPVVEPLDEACDIADRLERQRGAPSGVDPGNLGRQRLDLEPVDRGDEMAVVHQVVRQGEPGRAEPDDQHLVAGCRAAATAGGC